MTAITTGERAYDVVFDVTLERRALIVATVVDAVTGLAPHAPVRVAVDRRNAAVHIGSNGRIAISGRPAQAVPDPAKSYSFTLTIAAKRYRPATVIATVPPQPSFPIELSPIALQPLPVRLEGRVMRELDRTPATQTAITTVPTDKLLLLRRPAYRAYASGTTVDIVALTAGTPLTLTQAAPAGALRFTLDDVANLAANGVLRFDDREYGVIDTIDATAKRVTLQHALHSSYPAGTAVTPMTAGAPTATTTSRRDVARGDALLPVGDPTSGDTVVFGTPPEYHDLGARTDADGYFSIDGVGGERTLALVTGNQTTVVTIDSSKDVNPVRIRLRNP